jgi:hypothetical protein
MFNSSRRLLPVLTVLLFSVVLISLAAFAETCVQGPAIVPGNINFMAYLPGEYSLYEESTVDSKAKTDEANNNKLNALVKCTITGAGHLHILKSSIEFAGGNPYMHKDNMSGKYKVGKPFARFEILWPGRYNLHLESLNPQANGLNITAGPDGLITVAIIISLLAQIIVLIMVIKKEPA